KVHDLIEQMKEKRINLDVITYNTIIGYYLSEGAVDTAIRVFDQIVQPATASYNIFIQYFMKEGQIENAEHVFKTMGAKDEVTYRLMISGYFKRQRWKEAI